MESEELTNGAAARLLEHYSHIRIDAKRQALDALDNLRRGGDRADGDGNPARDAEIATIVGVADDLTSQSRYSLLLSGSPPSGKLLIPSAFAREEILRASAGCRAEAASPRRRTLERRDVRVVEGAPLGN